MVHRSSPTRTLIDDFDRVVGWAGHQIRLVAKAKDWPAWGHRKVTALLRADGVPAAEATVKRALRRNGLLLPVAHTMVMRELAAARRAAFVTPPWPRNQVWQLDFSEYETLGLSTWRLAGCADWRRTSRSTCPPRRGSPRGPRRAQPALGTLLPHPDLDRGLTQRLGQNRDLGLQLLLPRRRAAPARCRASGFLAGLLCWS
jgi:hypothetical protein